MSVLWRVRRELLRPCGGRWGSRRRVGRWPTDAIWTKRNVAIQVLHVVFGGPDHQGGTGQLSAGGPVGVVGGPVDAEPCPVVLGHGAHDVVVVDRRTWWMRDATPARSCSSLEVGRASPAVVSIQPLELRPSNGRRVSLVCGQ